MLHLSSGAIAHLIQAVKDSPDIATVQRAWQNILCALFVGSNQFIFENASPTERNEVVLTVRKLQERDSKLSEVDALVVLCKPGINVTEISAIPITSFDTLVEKQLSTLLLKSITCGDDEFGAVVIGRFVKFYRFTKSCSFLVQLNIVPLDVVNQTVEVEAYLKVIRDSAWTLNA